MRLHLGCGNVYLQGYVNIDLPIRGYSFLAEDRPDLVEKNRTTLLNYYKKPYSRAGPRDVLCVADAFMDILHLDYLDNSVDEILVVQTFEHLSRYEAQEALAEWRRVLRRGGKLIIDVPDFEALARELLAQSNEDEKEYYYRMIFGSQKNAYAFHKEGYTFPKLSSLLGKSGFVEMIDLGNILHPYPSVTIEAKKGSNG